jgi:WG repeat protein
MALRIRSNVIALVAVILAHAAVAQDKRPELTPAGAAILASMLASDGRPLYDRPGPGVPITFPLAMCTFPGGLCGAVRRDGTVAVPPRYDWVGKFSDGRAAVRSGGLYGFVDEDGREIVKPQYRIVDDYSFGFAQVDIDGKSGLIDRDGKIAIKPKYGFISAVAPDRFAVSESRKLGGRAGAEDFSGTKVALTPSGGISVTGLFVGSGDGFPNFATEIIDASGQRVGPPVKPEEPLFDKDDPSIRREKKDELWGLVMGAGAGRRELARRTEIPVNIPSE